MLSSAAVSSVPKSAHFFFYFLKATGISGMERFWFLKIWTFATLQSKSYLMNLEPCSLHSVPSLVSIISLTTWIKRKLESLQPQTAAHVFRRAFTRIKCYSTKHILTFFFFFFKVWLLVLTWASLHLPLRLLLFSFKAHNFVGSWAMYCHTKSMKKISNFCYALL